MLYNLFYCEHCSEVFSNTTGDFTEHLASHSVIEKKPYKCGDCNKSFASRSGLFKHRKYHTNPKPPKPRTCKYCKQKFTDQEDFENHKVTHVGERLYKCNVCDKSFCSSSGMYKHRSSHTIPKPYACKYCKQVFAEQKHCDTHMKFHTDRNRTFACDICNEEFNHRQSLLKHLRVHAGDETPYPCELCKKKFVYKKALQLHYKKRHSDENSGKCEVSPVPVEIALKDHLYFQTVRSCVSSSETKDSIDSSIAFIKNKKSPTKKQKSNALYCMGLPTETHLVNSTIEEKTLSNCIDTSPISPVPNTEFNIIQGSKVEELYNTKNSENNAVPEKDFLVQTQNVEVGEYYEICIDDSHDQVFENSERMLLADKIYKCNYCTKSYNTRAGLFKHRKHHPDPNSYTCSICKQVFADPKHWENNHKKNPGNNKDIMHVDVNNVKSQNSHTEYEGSYINDLQTNSVCFEDHLDNSMDFTDSLTNHTYDKEELKKDFIRSEKRIQANGKKTFSCAHCSRTFDCSKYLLRHLLLHMGKNICPCKHCSWKVEVRKQSIPYRVKKRNLRSVLRNNISDGIDSKLGCDQDENISNNHDNINQSPNKQGTLALNTEFHLNAKNVYECKECNQFFADKQRMAYHKQKVHESMYSCKVCFQEFHGRIKYKEHLVVHKAEQTKCQYCHKSFSRKDCLVTHLKIHSGEKPYTCRYCEKSFTIKRTLLTHMKIHTGKDLHACNYCEKKFVHKFGLSEHIRVHTGEKPFVCPHCHKAFNRIFTYTHHLKMHTIAKPFVCLYCRKSFATKQKRDSHLRFHEHNRNKIFEKVFSCSFCTKAFSSKDRFEKHVKTHTGDRYACPVCDKIFTYATTLKRHVKTHTGDSYSCPECDKKFTYATNLKKHAIAVHKMPFIDTLKTKLVKRDKRIEYPDDALTLLLQLAEIPATDVYIETT